MDVSNSMRRPVCGDERIQRFDIGPLLAYSWKARGEKVVAGVLGNTWRTIELPPPPAPHLPILAATDQFRRHEGEAGFAINAWLVIRDLVRKKQVVDKILIFTDCQLWNNRTFNQDGVADICHVWRQYRRQIAPESTLYLFDLAGYGISPLRMPEEGVYLLAGWNERFFDVLNIL
jgi:hypothetical protein